MNTDEEEEGKAKVRFLLNGSKALEADSCHILRSYFNIQSSITAQHYNLELPIGWTNRSVLCRYCCTPWSQAMYSLKLSPAVRRGKKIRKILLKLAKKKRLSTIEEKLCLLVHTGNKLSLKCFICNNATKFLINKIPKVTENVKFLIQEELESKGKEKKKRRKNDKFAGLTPIAVQKTKDEICEESNDSIVLINDGNNVDDVYDEMDLIKRSKEPKNMKQSEKFDNDVMIIDVARTPLQRHVKPSSCGSPGLNALVGITELGKKEKKNYDGFSLKVGPLDFLPVQPAMRSKAESFIPINCSRHRSNLGEKTKSELSRQNVRVLPNPFANKKQQKKLNQKFLQLQQIINEEKAEKQPSGSLKSFLSKL